MATYKYVTATGLIVPDTETLQAEVEGEFKAALGADLITTPNTPQGALITGEVVARKAVADNNATVANQINPNLAGGVFLDAIWALTGGERSPAERSVLEGVELLGLPLTPIPAGSQASLADGTVFETLALVTLDLAGEAIVDFQALEPGPIAAAPGTLVNVVSEVLGWDSVTNPTAAIPGRFEEADLPSRLRRRNTLSLQNVALPEAITSALYDVPGVRSLTFRENYTKSDATIDGIYLLANSVWACVDGGADEDVAQALLGSKSFGANWNGGIEVDIVDPASGQTYPVAFDRPDAVVVKARITVRGGTPEAVRAAVIDYANGLIEGEPGFTVGTSVSAFEIGGAVSRQVPGAYVKLCEISLLSPTSWGTGEIAVALNEKALILSGNIEVIEL